MGTYKTSLFKVFKYCCRYSAVIFFVGVFGILLFNSLMFAFMKNGLDYLVPLILVFRFILIYLVLPFLVSVILIKVLLKDGVGPMVFGIMVMSIYLLIIFLFVTGIFMIFIDWDTYLQLIKGPVDVVINLS